MMTPNNWHGGWKIILRGTVAAIMLMVASPWNGMSGEADGKPVLRIPKMAKPPTIDGKINEEEWAGASAVTGFTSLSALDQYPADMRAVWRLGYDDQNLYLAMHLPVPKGVTLNAQTKSPDDMDSENAVLFGDHVEIQITPHTPQRAMQTGFGFYKFIVNPFDIWSDYWHYCDEPGNESAWSSDARVKSTFDRENWWLEMAIPIVGTMKSPDGGLIKKADGLELIMQLVNSGSCVGYSFGGWVPDLWVRWDSFYRVILDPGAPVMQFVETGDLADGKLEAPIRLRGATGQAATVALDVLDVDGKSVFKDTKNLTLNPTDWSVAAFQQPTLAVPEWNEGQEKPRKRNHMLMRVESDGKTIYTANLPFVKHTPEWTKKTYGEYVNTLPKGNYKTLIAYIAGNGKFRVTVNTDVPGDLPKAVRDAQEFRLRIQSEKGGKEILDRKLPITKGLGSHLLELGQLEGAYDVTIDLLDAKGAVVSTRQHKFARVKHEWEKNTIGEERAVLPPFRPIAFEGETLRTLLAKIEVGKGGLWQSVTVQGKPLLAAPMRIEGSAGGQEFKWAGESVRIEKGNGRTFPPEFDQYAWLQRRSPVIPFEKLPETDGYDAVITGRGKAGPVAIDVKATLDYDGYTLFEVGYAPTAGKAKVERLEIVLDLFGGVNGMFAAREVGAAGFRSFPPDRQGALWESASMKGRQPRYKGTFMPLLHLGDGQYGLQFRAASDEGWLLDDNVSCMRVERQGETVRLRLLLVNAPATLDRARTVRFALMPLPAKSAPSNSRYNVWGMMDRDYAHSATGWRKYGTGMNNWYLPSDEEFVRLGEEIRAGKVAGRLVNPEIAATKPVLMYSSTVSSGSPQPDCDSFLGQWYRDSEVVFKGPIAGGGKGKSPTGQPYDRPECFTETRPLGWDEDLDDNYMWFHRKLTVLSETHGAYYDNAEITHFVNRDAGAYGYVREDGHEQPTNNSFQRRRLMKRLYTMGWLEGFPPLHNSKWPFQTPFHTFNFMWEGDWHIYSEDGTFYDAHSHDLAQLRFFRDGIATPAFIHQKIPGVGERTFDDRATRSYFALAILHDIGIDRVSATNSALLRTLDKEIGFLDRERQAEFIPYWEAAKPVKFVEWTASPGQAVRWRDAQPQTLYASVYRSQTQPKRSLLWIVNTGENDQLTGLRLDAVALTGKPRKAIIVRDLETGLQLRNDLPAGVTDKRDREELWQPFLMNRRSFRALLVEEGVYVAPPSPQWP